LLRVYFACVGVSYLSSSVIFKLFDRRLFLTLLTLTSVSVVVTIFHLTIEIFAPEVVHSDNFYTKWMIIC